MDYTPIKPQGSGAPKPIGGYTPVDSIPKPAAPTSTPEQTGGFWNAIKSFLGSEPTQAATVKPTVEPKTVGGYTPMTASSAPSASQGRIGGYTPMAPKQTTESPYFYNKFPSGATIGRADQIDTSGRPFFAYRNPGDTATTTDKTRVATTFDPTKAQPLTKEQYYNPRTAGLRDQFHKEFGISPSEELDHAIALTVGGSNNIQNLRAIPKADNRAAGTLELRLAKDLIAGKISYFDAQIEDAKAKGIVPPWTPSDMKGKSRNEIWDALKERARSMFDEHAATPPVSGTPAERALAMGGSSTISADKGTGLKKDPISKGQHFAETVAQTELDAVKDLVKRLNETASPTNPLPPVERITKGVSAAMGIVNTVFSPITGFMKAGEDVPIIGKVAKGVNKVFEGVAEVAAFNADKVVAALPISDDHKEQIRPVAEELFALGAQIALGKVSHEIAAPKIAALTQDIKSIARESFIKATKDKTTIVTPEGDVFIHPDTIRDYIAGREITDQQATDLYKTLGRTSDQIRQDVKNGLNVEVPAQTIEILKDKPYWAAIKGLFDPKRMEGVSRQGGFAKNPFAGESVPEKRPEWAGPTNEEIATQESNISKDLQPLAEEAKKYKTAEDFTKAQLGDDLKGVANNEFQKQVRTQGLKPLRDTDYGKKLNLPENLPIYRATTRTSIAPGDIVALSEGRAQGVLNDYTKHDGIKPKLLNKIVNLDDLMFNSNGDVIYAPQGMTSLEDFYNKAVGSKESAKVPATAKAAQDTYFKDVIESQIGSGKTIELAGDNMKGHFGKDYNPDRSSLYSEATYQSVEKLLQDPRIKNMRFLGGGPGSGKSEFLGKSIKERNATDLLYDNSFSNVEGVRHLIEVAKKNNKPVGVSAIIANRAKAKGFTKIREEKTGRPVTDKAFNTSHDGFIETLGTLLEDGTLKKGQVHLFDLRNITTPAEVRKIVSLGIFAQDPLALIKKAGYKEKNGKPSLRKEDTGSSVESRNRKEPVPPPRGVGSDTKREPAPTGESGRVLRSEEGKVGAFDLKPESKKERLEIEAANQKYIKETITQGLEEAHKKAVEGIKADSDLAELEATLSNLEESLATHPAKDLTKFMNKRTGELPEVTGIGPGKFAISGDDIVTEKGFADSEEARERVGEVIALRREIADVRHEIQMKKLDVRDKVKALEDEAVLGKMAAREEKHINEILGSEAEKTARLERIDKLAKEAAKNLADETKFNDLRKEAIKKAQIEARKKNGLVGALRSTFGPVANTDAVTQRIYNEWNGKVLSAKEVANQVEESFVKRGFGGTNDIQEIMEYQAGKKTPWIREFFDDKWTEGRRRGLEANYREDYFPQVYKEKPQIIKEKIAEFLTKEGGLSKEDAQAYADGDKELPEYVAIRLKMTPSFVKTRVFPDYATAFRYGLTPRYMTIPQHMAYYVAEMEKVIANKEMVADFIKNHKFLDRDDAPQSWIEVKVPGDRSGHWKASPDLANALNKQFQLDDNMGIVDYIMKDGAAVSRLMMEIKLSGGLPYTPVNYFAVGQVIRSLTTTLGAAAKFDMPLAAAELRAAKSFVRSFSNTQSIKWLKANSKYIEMMGRHGISLPDHVGAFDMDTKNFFGAIGKKSTFKEIKDSLKSGKDNIFNLSDPKTRESLFGEKGESKVINLIDRVSNSGAMENISKMYDEAFNQKTFKSMLPQMQVEIFKSMYEQAKKGGLEDPEAQAFAAEIAKNEFGTIANLGRSKAVQNGITTLLMAPRFRETLVNTFANTLKSFTTQAKNPAYKNNRALLLGAILSFAIYQAINHAINGDFTWDNESGRKFSIKLTLPNGKLAYVEFLPSFFATPRMLTQAGIALAQGDVGEATHQASGLLSMPINLTADALTNKDHFGRPIYEDTDSAPTKVWKSIEHVGSGVVHPYATELNKYFQGKEPLYEALSIMAEVPVKYSNVEKESTGKYFDKKDEMTLESQKQKKAFQPTYDKIKNLVLSGNISEAEKAYNSLSQVDQATFMTMKRSETAKKRLETERQIYTTVEKVRGMVLDGDKAGAQKIYNSLTDEQKKAFITVKKQFFSGND